MERLSPSRQLGIHISALAGLIGGVRDLAAYSGTSRHSIQKHKPTKLCCHPDCRKPHTTGKPCCSAECFRAWKAGEPLPAKPSESVLVVFDHNQQIVHLERSEKTLLIIDEKIT